jgi:hypothetical protein
MTLLKNAVESIQMGVEDFESGDARRGISAMRNITAGLLLLFKTKLCDLSPQWDKELLIKKDLTPGLDQDGKLIFVGKGRKTVDVAQIKERLKAMKVDVDWGRVDELTFLRNEIEHYYASATPEVVREVVAKSFLLIRDFAQNALRKDPQELLGDECWQVLMNTSDVYMAELAACQATLRKVDWKYETIRRTLVHFHCPQCSSALVDAPSTDDTYPTINLRCKSCNNEFLFEDIVEDCVSELLSVDAHLSVKDGGDTPYDTCPQCGRDTFVHAEGKCVACEEELEYTQCGVCEEPLSIDDQVHDGLCSYCQYRLDRAVAD